MASPSPPGPGAHAVQVSFMIQSRHGTRSAQSGASSDLRRQIDTISRNRPLRQSLEAVASPVLVLNREDRMIFANEEFYRFLGTAETSEELRPGMRFGELIGCRNAENDRGGCGFGNGCDACQGRLAIENAREGTPEMRVCQIAQLEHWGGRTIDLEVKARPVELDGEPFTVVSITDRTGEKRREMLERIFFHDIMNSASVLTGLLSLMKLHGRCEDDPTFEKLDRTTKRLVSELQAQYMLNAAERNELAVTRVPVHSRHLLEEIAEDYDRSGPQRSRRVRVAPETEDVRFVTDPVLLSRVIINMVKNAMEAIEPDQEVTLSCGAEDACVVFRVHNPGVIAEGVREHIFHRSFSTKGHGRGLGTYGLKLLSERFLHGKVGFESDSERGTVFFARFPLTEEMG